VHLFGFIIRIYHDARSPERQIHHHIILKPFIIFSVVQLHSTQNNHIRFPKNFFSLADPFWLRNKTKDLRMLAQLRTDDSGPKVKIVTKVRIHTSDINNYKLRHLTLSTDCRFLCIGSSVIRYSTGHTE